jgi:hypothetical protein
MLKGHNYLNSIVIDTFFYITKTCFAWFEKNDWLKGLAGLEVRVKDNAPDSDDESIKKMDQNIDVHPGSHRVFKILESAPNLKHFKLGDFRYSYCINQQYAEPTFFKKSNKIRLAGSDAEYVLGFRKHFVEHLTIDKQRIHDPNCERAVSECIRLKTLSLALSATGGLTFNLFKTLVNLTTLELYISGANFNLESDDQFPPNNLLQLKQLDLTGIVEAA